MWRSKYIVWLKNIWSILNKKFPGVGQLSIHWFFYTGISILTQLKKSQIKLNEINKVHSSYILRYNGLFALSLDNKTRENLSWRDGITKLLEFQQYILPYSHILSILWMESREHFITYFLRLWCHLAPTLKHVTINV